MKYFSAPAKATMFAALAFVTSAYAQQSPRYPDKPVRVIVTWPAGGAVDVGTRAVTNALSISTGQPFIVENRPGANGSIGTEVGARANPDGYTIIVGNADTFAINPYVYPNLKYDPIKSFEPIAPLGTLPLALTLRSQFTGSTASDVVRLAKEQPGKLTYGSWGVGSLGHVGLALFEQAAGIEMLHVPYQGGAPATAAIMGNQIDMLVTQVPLAESLQKAGKVKILGVTSAKRSSLFPNIPTIAEQGYPSYVAEQWVGFFFPSGTPRQFSQVIAKEINAFVQSPNGQAQLREIGYDATGGSGTDLTTIVVNDNKRWSSIIKERKIRNQ